MKAYLIAIVIGFAAGLLFAGLIIAVLESCVSSCVVCL